MNDERLVRLERQVRTLQVSLVAACCTVGLLGLAAFRSQDSPHILRVPGLIVEDSLGRERILIGAPIPGASRRVRTDTARVARVWGPRFPKSSLQYYKSYRHDMDGMLVLDASGFDRLAVGQNVPDPNIGQRIGRSTGVIINDSLGFERSGYGLLTVNGQDRVVLGLDIRGDEAATLVADEQGGIGFIARDSARSLYLGRTTLPGDTPGTSKPFFGLLLQEGSHVRVRLPANTGP